MSTVALILAAGEQARWMGDGYKQLLRVGDETIMGRVVRQCRERSIVPNIIVSCPDLYWAGTKNMNAGWSIFDDLAQPHRWTVETLLSTRALWQSRTIVLLGDTVYSKATMDRIFNAPDQPLCVFGNLVEIYALVMRPTDQHLTDVLCESIAYAERMVTVDDRKGHGKLRKFYQRYCGLDVSGPTDIENKVLQWVDGLDYTRDVDLPRDYDALLREVVQAGRLDDLPDLNPCIDIYECDWRMPEQPAKWSGE